MNIVKTIRQHSTTYTIYEGGKRSFRISFVRDGERRSNYIEHIFDTVADCEEFISTCNSMDAMCAMFKGGKV